MSYYVIEHQRRRADRADERWLNWDHIVISTAPAWSTRDGDICTQGWCGSTDHEAVMAHGEYETVADALAAIRKIWREVRDVTNAVGDDAPPDYGDEVIAIYKPGRYPRLSPRASVDLARPSIEADISAKTYDWDIDALVDACEAKALANKRILDRKAVRTAMLRRRDLLATRLILGIRS